MRHWAPSLEIWSSPEDKPPGALIASSSGGTYPKTSANASGSPPDPRPKPAPSHRCDEEIEAVLGRLSDSVDAPSEPLPAPRHKARQPNGLSFDVRAALYALLGVDLTQIHGVGPYLALKIVSECGTDMSRWPSAKHFTSWLALAPANKVSGGRVLSSRTRRSSNRAAAVTVGRTDTALGAFYRRLSSRVGKAKAVTATARKIAVLLYNTLRHGQRYEDPGASYYEERYRQRVLKSLRRRAASLGYVLQEGVEVVS